MILTYFAKEAARLLANSQLKPPPDSFLPMDKGQVGVKGGLLSSVRPSPLGGRRKGLTLACQSNLAPFARLWRAHSIGYCRCVRRKPPFEMGTM